MNADYPCTCGHPKDSHWEQDDNDNISDGVGHCQEEIDPSGHHCSSCSYDPEDYCRCEAFEPDNLKYLEDLNGK